MSTNIKILVTGGLGYIGSHTVVELLNEGYKIVIIDDLSNASIDVLQYIKSITGILPEFEELDLKNKIAVQDFFKRHQDIEGVIHFAGKKAVGESVKKPLLYYENNLNTLIYVLSELNTYGISNIIFSSSCTVYGKSDQFPIPETALLKPAESPYGNTKQISEEIIYDNCKIHPQFKAVVLRYFNPIGAHSSARIGELPLYTPQNLVPFITQTAIGKHRELEVFGGDYPTPDGTCIRDYIHVVDLAKAHVLGLNRLINNKQSNNFEVFNIGTGKGNSVLEIIHIFEKISGKLLNYKIVNRRLGDVATIYADTTKANTILGWKASYNIEEAVQSAWKWEQYLSTL